jgi:PAS domain-containing protein
MSNKVIAQRLALSPRTVELYRATTMEELDVGSLAEALRMAIDAELTPLSEAHASDLPLDEQDDTSALSSEQTAPAAGNGAIPPLPHPTDILEGTTDCVFLVDHEWRFTYINANARQLIACGQDLIGVELWERFPLAASTRAWDELHRAAADRRPTRFEFYEPDLRSWLDASVRPYSAGLQICFRNISHERYSSAQLRLSEENLLQALEAAGDGAWDWDMQTGEVAMSPAFLARLGYGPGAFSPTFDNFVHLVHPEDLPALTRSLKDHLEGCSESFRCEYRLRRSDGGWLWNLDRGRIVARHPVTALPLRMVGSASDITHIKAAQQTAEEALKRLEVAQGNAGVGLWDLDLASGVVRFCERSRAMHGLSAEGPLELTGEVWSSTVHDDDREQVVAKLKEYIASGETYRICYRTVSADHTVRWVLGMGRAVSGHDGNPERFGGLNVEITALTALIDDADDDDVLVDSRSDILPRGDDAIDRNDGTAP